MITSLSNCLSKNATPFGDFLCQKWGLSGANSQVAMCTQGASGHDDAQNAHLFYWKNRHLHFQHPKKNSGTMIFANIEINNGIAIIGK
jgi:hypothetical protein